jgi:error-prone DNA polymerase
MAEIGNLAMESDMNPDDYIELHCASAFSFLRAGSSVEALVARAAELGMPALALTDDMTLAGVVRFQAACAERGLRAIVGAELAVADPIFGDAAQPARLVALARSLTGYANLCQLLTDANLTDPERPIISLRSLADHREGLILLTGGRGGTLARLLLDGQRAQAEEAARRYAALFGRERVYVELQHHLLADSRELMQRLVWVAEAAGLRVVATNGVRHARREDYPLYDLLTCARLGISVDEAHRERPRNDEAHLKPSAELAALFAGLPWADEALATTAEIAAACELSLLKGVCTAPRVPLPEGETPTSQLHALCEVGMRARYANELAALAPGSRERRQMAHELAVIARLELAEFFLVVCDIVATARRMRIRCSGRGSAANSIVAYLLGITGVDPIQHNLLFERFLNPERRGMPDIDIDVQSDRREELIRYVERAYSERHAAMVANVSTYRPRSAMRDAAKALGFPLPLVNALTKVLPHHCGRAELPGYRDELRQVIRGFADLDAPLRSRCLDRLDVALELAPRMLGLPRHLSLHNGGIVLSREPLSQLLPVRISANGVRALEVDKDDVERLGLIKFDVLGLRTLGAVEEALALIEETTGVRPDVDHLPVDPPDERTMELIRAGQTLAVFQIESPGQWHLLAQTQPRTFDDLIVQTALFRPGPIIGGFVRPYVARRQRNQERAERRERQRDAVQTPWHGEPADTFWTRHPVLGPILADTEGILLFQEQVLLIAHAFAGLSYAEADGFRRAMSHVRTSEEMEAMRERFVAGAVARGERAEDASRVFEAISAYTGYGFCKSHAAEFGRVIYQTAWLKAHYPAHYLAAFLSAQPAGFFPPHVVLEEAKQLGIPVLGVDINRSADRFAVERVGSPPGRWAIRIGLAQVAHVGAELAEAILWERQGRWPERAIDVWAAGETKPQRVLGECRRGTEVPAYDPDGLKSTDVSQQLRPSETALHESLAPSADFRPSSPCTGTCRGVRWTPSPPRSHQGETSLAPAIVFQPAAADSALQSAQADCAAARPSGAVSTASHFTSLADFCARLRPYKLSWQAAESLVLAGACDGLKPAMDRRQRLWQLHEVWPLGGAAPTNKHASGQGGRGRRRRREKPAEQLALAWEVAPAQLAPVPPLPSLDAEARVALDYQLLGLSSRPHPMRLLRRELRRRGVRTIAELETVAEGRVVRVAGWPISAQRPPTAKGMGFLVLEDETGRLPVALPPRLAAELYRAIRGSRAVVVTGRVERVRWYRSLLALGLERHDLTVGA